MGDDRGDAELVRLSRLGDRGAFEGLVMRYGPGLYRFGRRMVGHDDLTEDCVQETFISAWLGIERFREESSVKTWLFGIMTNKVRHELRRGIRERTISMDEVDLAGDEQPANRAEVSELLHALDTALATLPPDQRACWLLKEVEGLSYQQIAEIQGTTADAVRGRLARARESLGGRLKGWR